MPAIVALLFISLFTFPLSAATDSPALICDRWLDSRANGQAWAAAPDDDGSVFWTGQEAGAMDADIFLCHTSATGETIRCVTWGASGKTEKGFAIKLDGDRVYVAGVSQTNFILDDADMVLIAFRKDDLHEIWSRFWSGSGGYNEADGLEIDGSYIYLSGWTGGRLPLGTGADVGLVCYRNDGELQWGRAWGSDGWDQADGAMAIVDGRIYIAGRWNAPNYYWGGDALLAWFDQDTGEHMGHTTWGGSGFDDAYTLAYADQALYLAGPTGSYGEGGQLFLLKFTTDGDLIWETLWGGPAAEHGRTIITGPGYGELCLLASTESYGNGLFDIALIRYQDNGADCAFRDLRVWGGAGQDGAEGAARSGDLLFIAASHTPSGASNTNAVLLATTLTGECYGQNLRINQPSFRANERFLLSISMWNFTASPLAAELAVVLDVYGEYWFYPSWGQALDTQSVFLHPGAVDPDRSLLDFTWPGAGNGQLSPPVFFYSGLLDPERNSLLTNYDQATFQFE